MVFARALCPRFLYVLKFVACRATLCRDSNCYRKFELALEGFERVSSIKFISYNTIREKMKGGDAEFH